MEQPQYNLNEPEPQPEPNWEVLQDMVTYMQEGRVPVFSDVIVLMSAIDQDTLDFCSLDFQRRFWERMVIADDEEALNYRWKYLDKPYARDILQKIAMKDPAFVIGKSLDRPEDTTLQRMRGFLSHELGREKIEEIIKERGNTFFRRLFRKIFGEDEKDDKKPAQKPETLTSDKAPSTIVS